MSGGMCPHIFGAWCPHYTSTCSENQMTSKCIHLPAFMISPFEDNPVEELENIRELFQHRKKDPQKPDS
jgi:hypothetical protein